MKQTLIKTQTVQCKWLNQVQMLEQKQCQFNDRIAIHSILISDFENKIPYLRTFLNDGEILKSENFLMDKDKNRYIISRAILKRLLGKYLNKSSNDIEFSYERNLKPKVKSSGSNIHFNVSHSGNMILIAISDAPIGIDLEIKDENFSYKQILEVTFSPEELDFLHKNKKGCSEFFLLWTRKEALLKGTGKGIDNDLPFIPSLDGKHQRDSELIWAIQDWSVVTFNLELDYLVSVATQSQIIHNDLKIYNTEHVLF